MIHELVCSQLWLTMPEVAPVATMVLAIVDIVSWLLSGDIYAFDAFDAFMIFEMNLCG